MMRLHRSFASTAIALALTSTAPEAAHAARKGPAKLEIAIGGDLLGPYHAIDTISDGGFDEVKRVLGTADAVIANHEHSTFDAEDVQFYPSAENNGLPLSPAAVARDLRALGVTMLSKANNHAADWGLEGLQASEAALTRAGIAFAGSGGDETAARSASVIDTPDGKVGLVSMSSTFQAMAQAADASQSRRGMLRARPGISVVRLTPAMRLKQDDFAQVSRIAGVQSVNAQGRVTLGTQTFVRGDTPGFDYAMDPRDETAILKGIGEGVSRARAVVVAIHAHETDNGDSEDPAPPDFLVQLAHRSIDAGAAAFVRHGPHGVNGIEIYRGRPIFYGVGSMYFDFGGRRTYTVPATGQVIRFSDTWFEGFIAKLIVGKAGPEAVQLHPIVFDDGPTEKSGIPRLAHGADAQRILSRVQRYSEPFGTQISIERDVGSIKLGRRP
jgi:poly-gamma-glutamate synthesis protein (capsule biosynthesis protein)